MKRLILASASPRRRALLEQLGLPFEVIASDVDEIIDSVEQPASLVMRLAMAKAEDIYNKTEGQRLVVAADTVVVKDGRILGKPKDEHEAFKMLKLLQGGYHHVYTGLAVMDSEKGLTINDFEVTAVKMAPIDDEKINAYISSGEPMDKAGAYAIQGKGAVFIERVEGCYYNVVGLPLSKLFAILEECGIMVF